MAACFDNSEVWLETEVNKKNLTAEVFKAINLEFEGWEIDEAERVLTPEMKGYEIVLEKEDTEVEVIVAADGKLTIKK